MISDQSFSSGKFISFVFRNLVFRDSCLIAMSPIESSGKLLQCRSMQGLLPARRLAELRKHS